MNKKFAKTAIAVGIVAAGLHAEASFAASQPAVAGDTVVIGCSVPSSGATGGLVYIVDATSSVSTSAATYSISLPAAVAAGQSCAAAIQAITTGAAKGATGVYFHPVNPVSGQTNSVTTTAEAVSVPNTGYGLVAHTFIANATDNIGNVISPVFVGCTAGTTTAGSTVYSVDTSAVAEPLNIATIQGALGKPCSQGLATVAQSTAGAGVVFTLTGGGASNVIIPSVGYSLNLYTFQ